MKDPDESGEFWYAYNAYHTNGLLPSEFVALPRRERAMLIAFIQIRAEKEKEESRKAKSSRRR